MLECCLYDISCLTSDIHELVEVGFTEERLLQFPEVALEDASHGVEVIPIIHHREGVTTLLEVLLELGNISLQVWREM